VQARRATNSIRSTGRLDSSRLQCNRARETIRIEDPPSRMTDLPLTGSSFGACTSLHGSMHPTAIRSIHRSASVR